MRFQGLIREKEERVGRFTAATTPICHLFLLLLWPASVFKGNTGNNQWQTPCHGVTGDMGRNCDKQEKKRKKWNTGSRRYSSALAAITKYHRLWLKDWKFIFHSCEDWEVQNQGASPSAPSLAGICVLLCAPRAERASCGISPSSYKDNNPTWGPILRTVSNPKALFSNTIILEVRTSTSSF